MSPVTPSITRRQALELLLGLGVLGVAACGPSGGDAPAPSLALPPQVPGGEVSARAGFGAGTYLVGDTDLVSRTYTPLFSYVADNPGSFRVLAGDFIDTTGGTGVVHLAPGFGGERSPRVFERRVRGNTLSQVNYS